MYKIKLVDVSEFAASPKTAEDVLNKKIKEIYDEKCIPMQFMPVGKWIAIVYNTHPGEMISKMISTMPMPDDMPQDMKDYIKRVSEDTKSFM